MFPIPIYENYTHRTHLLSLYVSIYAMDSLSFVCSTYSLTNHNELISEKTIQLLQRRTKIDLSFKRKLQEITKGKIKFIEQLVCYESYLV